MQRQFLSLDADNFFHEQAVKRKRGAFGSIAVVGFRGPIRQVEPQAFLKRQNGSKTEVKLDLPGTKADLLNLFAH